VKPAIGDDDNQMIRLTKQRTFVDVLRPRRRLDLRRRPGAVVIDHPHVGAEAPPLRDCLFDLAHAENAQCGVMDVRAVIAMAQSPGLSVTARGLKRVSRPGYFGNGPAKLDRAIFFRDLYLLTSSPLCFVRVLPVPAAGELSTPDLSVVSSLDALTLLCVTGFLVIEYRLEFPQVLVRETLVVLDPLTHGLVRHASRCNSQRLPGHQGGDVGLA
jgi:hypothetical protein